LFIDGNQQTTMIGKFNQGQIVDTGSVQIIQENIKK